MHGSGCKGKELPRDRASVDFTHAWTEWPLEREGARASSKWICHYRFEENDTAHEDLILRFAGRRMGVPVPAFRPSTGECCQIRPVIKRSGRFFGRLWSRAAVETLPDGGTASQPYDFSGEYTGWLGCCRSGNEVDVFRRRRPVTAARRSGLNTPFRHGDWQPLVAPQRKMQRLPPMPDCDAAGGGSTVALPRRISLQAVPFEASSPLRPRPFAAVACVRLTHVRQHQSWPAPDTTAPDLAGVSDYPAAETPTASARSLDRS